MDSSSPPSPASSHRCRHCCPDREFAPTPPPPIAWTVKMLELPPELQSEIFFHLPNLASVVSLRLTCRQTDAAYRPNAHKILASVRSHYTQPFLEYYEFLQRLKLPENSVKPPLPGGWPSITPEAFAPLNKTAFAVSVLKHFPYLDGSNPWSESTHVGYKSDVIDYTCFKNEGQDIQDSGDDWAEQALDEESRGDRSYDDVFVTGIRHTVQLVDGHESGGIILILDTFSGIVFEEEVRGDPRSRLSPREYCDKRMERLRNLDEVFYNDETTYEFNNWDAEEYAMPLNEHDFAAIEAEGEPRPADGGEDDKYSWVAYLYHKFGWPGKEYRKEECLAEIVEFCGRWQQGEDDIWVQEQAQR